MMNKQKVNSNSLLNKFSQAQVLNDQAQKAIKGGSSDITIIIDIIDALV